MTCWHQGNDNEFILKKFNLCFNLIILILSFCFSKINYFCFQSKQKQLAEVEAKERNDDQQHDAALTAIGLFYYLLLFKKIWNIF